MQGFDLFFNLLMLVGGLALFLYGMNTMGDGLKKLSGGKLEKILDKLTSTRIKGFFLGLGVTAAIQSSSATIVMLVGFVNSGIMRLGQTISIIMGANIGTTVTAWLLSTANISGESFILRMLKPESFTPVLALIGVLMTMVGKNDKKKSIGTILLGFSVLMYGMNTMSGSMSSLKDSPGFTKMITMVSNPVAAIVFGTLFTAVIQSSSASVGVLQALSQTGAIPFSVAAPIVLGENLGATVTPALSALSGNRNAKRVAVATVYIKIIGVIIFAVVFYALDYFVKFPFMRTFANPFTIAIFHTLFNVISTIFLMPFCKFIEKITILTVRGKETGKTNTFDTLDDRFLSMPTFAIEKCRKLVSDMANTSRKSFVDALSMLDNYDSAIASSILSSEDVVDTYEDKTSSYLLKISSQNLSQHDSLLVSQMLHVIGDVERISDHAVNVLEAAREINEKGLSFSNKAYGEITVMANAVSEILSLSIDALVLDDLNIAKRVEPLEQIIDNLKYKIKNNHIKRLRAGECTVELGFILSDLLTNFERVADHCSNIAVCMLELDNNSFETHEYLSHVKKDGENEFFEHYEIYKKRYSI